MSNVDRDVTLKDWSPEVLTSKDPPAAIIAIFAHVEGNAAAS